MLAMKIIQGGKGNWGHSLMAAHPDLSISDAESMVEYILSMKDENNSPSLPVEGTFLLSNSQNRTDRGIYVISVGYEDHGNEEIPAIEASKIQFLRAPYLQAEDYDVFKNVEQQRPNGGSFAYVSSLRHGSYVGFDNIDLNGVDEIMIKVMPISGGRIAIFQGGFDGEPLAELSIPSAEKRPSWVEESFVEYNFTINEASKGSKALFILFSDANNTKVDMNLDQITFKQK
jgi:cytochrome c